MSHLKFTIMDFLASPLWVPILLLALFWFLKKGWRWATALLVVGVLALTLLTTNAMVNTLYNIPIQRSTPYNQTEKAGAIVVLGGGVTDTGMLVSRSQERVTAAVKLYQQGLAPMILTTGASNAPPYEPDGGAKLMKELAIGKGVSDTAIFTIPGYTTRQEAINVGKLLNRLRIRKILLVTDYRHMPRAAATFRKLGYTVITHTALPSLDRCGKTFSWCNMESFFRTTYEYLAQFYYKKKGWID